MDYAQEALDDYAFEITHIIGQTEYDRFLEMYLGAIQRARTATTLKVCVPTATEWYVISDSDKTANQIILPDERSHSTFSTWLVPSPCLTRSLQLETRQNFLGVHDGTDFNLSFKYCCRHMHW